MFKRLIASLICLTFIFNNIQTTGAQASPATGGGFSINQLPVPGMMVGKSAPFAPLALKGLAVNPQRPLEFKFIVDTGRGPQDSASVKNETNQLVKYFLAGLTIPESNIWVNLSPYEKNRMVPEALGQTDLGRDLLAQDYILKQLTASLIYPEKDLGKEFWNSVYAKAQEKFGTTNVPVNTFNKVWILPNKAQVFEKGNAAFVTKSTLKVMLDEDYLAKQKHQATKAASISSQIVRKIILPEINKEVNTGKNFASLRQIYQSLILAKWYKETIKNGLLDTIYTNKNKVAGVNLDNPVIKEQIYNRYLQAYKKGAFNYIKETPTPDGQVVPRKYFSGGITIEPKRIDFKGNAAMISAGGWVNGALRLVAIRLGVANIHNPVTQQRSRKMAIGVLTSSLILGGVTPNPVSADNKTQTRTSSAVSTATVHQNQKAIDEMIMAAYHGDQNKVQDALASGIDINGAHSRGGQTALMMASMAGQTEMVAFLINHSADVNAKSNQGRTALMIATQFARGAIVKLLLDAHANVNDQNEYGETALMISSRGELSIVEMLLAKGADFRLKDINGTTALVVASSWWPGNIAIVNKLLERANVNDVNAKDEFGKTALMFASHIGLTEVVKALLAKGADPYENGSMALTMARQQHHPEIVAILTGAGKKDKAMLLKPNRVLRSNLTPENGGIDLNQIDVNRTGKTINVHFEQAQLNELVQGGFEGFMPVITGITRISSPFQLLGINSV